MTADLELGLAIRRSLIGTPGPRREDRELLDGTATFVADIRLPGLVDAAFVRSPYAHAAIDGIDLTVARSFPSVHLAVAAADLTDVQEFPQFLQFLKNVHLFPLARDRVRYVGSPVAVIVAGDRYVAEDACMEVVVDYRELPVVRSVDESLAPDATKLYEDWPDNKLLYFPHSSPEVAEAFKKYQSIKTTCRTQRQSANPIETRGVVADYRGGRLTVWSSTQAPHMLRSTLSFTLGLSEAQIRVIAPQVGGGFGAKLHQYPEEVLVAWLAKTLRRPVRWIEDRSEHMVSAVHARDQVMEVEAAFDDRGYVHALRCNLVTDVGSGEIFAPGTATSLVSAGVLTGPYKIPYSDVTITCAVTNKTPSGAYRGFGAPEAVFAMERTIERIAKQLDRDVNALREMMLIKPEDLPYTIASGGILDSGSHLESFQRTVQLAEPLTTKARRSCSSNGRIRVGVGYSSYVEATAPTHFGTSGLWTAYDAASIKITPDGGAVVSVGVAATGQGTETMVATLAADALQIPLEKLSIAIGDTDLCPYGLGAWGSRSTVVMSGSIVKAAAKIFEKASTIAANMLEANAADIVVEQGSYHVARFDDPGGDTRRDRDGGLRPNDGAARGSRPWSRGDRHVRSARRHALPRLPREDECSIRMVKRESCCGGRSGRAHRCDQGCRLCSCSRLRDRHQPDDRDRPDSGRSGTGNRRRPLRAPLLLGRSPTAVGLVHGLPDPDSHGNTRRHGGSLRNSSARYPARSEGRRGVGHDRNSCCGRERCRKRPGRVRCRCHLDAYNPRDGP